MAVIETTKDHLVLFWNQENQILAVRAKMRMRGSFVPKLDLNSRRRHLLRVEVRSLGTNNWLRTGLHEQGTQVIGVHPGLMETEMVSQLTLPKVKPGDVVRQVFSAIETELDEVLADEIARQVKAGLSKEPGIYLDFDPGRDLTNAAKA